MKVGGGSAPSSVILFGSQRLGVRMVSLHALVGRPVAPGFFSESVSPEAHVTINRSYQLD